MNLTEIQKLADQGICEFRKRLVESSRRSNLINLSFGQTSTILPLINRDSNLFIKQLLNGNKIIEILPLPDDEQEPLDETDGPLKSHFKKVDYGPFIEDATKEIKIKGWEHHYSEKEVALRLAKNELRKRLQMVPDSVPISRRGISKEDYAEMHLINPVLELSSPFDSNHGIYKESSSYQTLLKENELNTKIKRLLTRVNSVKKEQAYNTLYLVSGCLNWIDSQKQEYTSPLLVIEAEIERKSKNNKYKYFLKSNAKNINVNEALIARLDEDGIVLPSLNEDLDLLEQIDYYHNRVHKIIETKRGWHVSNRIAISIIDSKKMAIANKLKRNKSGHSDLIESELITKLLTTVGNSQPGYPEDYNYDKHEYAEILPKIVEIADSSQISAMIDVIKGNNIVIKGPPGTGKSQTLSNIIADGLYRGKRILFISDKLAALEVVKKRLDAKGIGQFCLELHDGGSSKKGILQALEERLKLSKIHLDDYKNQKENYSQYRDKLNRYSSTLNDIYHNTGRTIHDLIWKYITLEDQKNKITLENPSRIIIPNSSSINPVSIQELSQRLDALEKSYKETAALYSNPYNNPWNLIKNFNLTPVDINNLKICITDIANITKEFLVSLNELNNITDTEFKSWNDIKIYLNNIKLFKLPTFEFTQQDLKILKDPKKREALGLYNENIDKISACRKNIEQHIIKVENIDIVQPLLNELLQLSNHLDSRESVDNPKQLEPLSQAKIKYAYALKLIGKLKKEEGALTAQNLKNFLKLINEVSILDWPLKTKKAILNPDIQKVFNDSFEYWKKYIGKQLSTRTRFHKNSYSLSDIEEAITKLEEAGLLGFLSSDVKNAKKVAREVCQMDTSEKSSAIKELKLYANFLKEKSSFEQNINIQKIKDAFNISSLSELKEFERSFNWFQSQLKDGVDSNALQILCSLNKEDLEDFIHYSKKEEFKVLFDHTRELESDTDISDYYKNAMTSIDNLLEVLNRYTDLVNVRINSNLTLKSLEELDNSIIRYYEIIPVIEKEASSLGELSLNHDLKLMQEYANYYWKLPLTENLHKEADLKKILSIQAQINEVSGIMHRKYEKLSTLNNELKSLSSTSIELEEVIFSDEYQSTFENCIKYEQSLSSYIAFEKKYFDFNNTACSEIIDTYKSKEIPMSEVSLCFDYILHNSLIQSIYHEYPFLSEIGVDEMSDIRVKFSELDSMLLDINKAEIIQKLSQSNIPEGNNQGRKRDFTELALIRNEISKQKGHVPPRELLRRSGRAINQLCPCFMMSPLSVASMLETKADLFDMVLIDESSQVKAEEALLPIYHAQQVVIVGDEQQMPPTNFFDKQLKNDDNDEDEDLPTEVSILDLGMNTFNNHRMLNRHYRSKHERLIQFSNYEFYHNRLHVIPSPSFNSKDLGVQYHYVHDGQYIDKTNIFEAEALIDKLSQFMLKNKDKSVGVATFNESQKDLLDETLEKAMLNHPHIREYISKWEDNVEDFFIKNLEMVQGDERDVMFISTLFGPDKNGIQSNTQLGPISRDGGYKRLNVLFTRAKEQVVIFSSLDIEKIKTDGKHSGARILRDYLTYSKEGFIQVSDNSDRAPDSEYEIEVMNEIKNAGYDCRPQVGVNGFFIDIGVIDPNLTGRYLCGIEFDGATYHSSRTARDRDRIRQEVLEANGWNIYRIWSTDWIRDKRNEVKKLISYLGSSDQDGLLPVK